MDPKTPSGTNRSILGIVGRAAFTREFDLKHLATEPDLCPVDLGSGGAETVDRARSINPDLVVVDLAPADSCRLAEALLEALPGIRPVAVHRSLGTDELLRLAEAGYVGFVSTECGVSDLLREIRAVLREESSGSPQLAGALLRIHRRRERERSPETNQPAYPGLLTRREQEVALLLEQRFTNKEIAATLGVGFGTAKNHVHNVLAKLGVSTRWELPSRNQGPGSSALRLLANLTRRKGGA